LGALRFERDFDIAFILGCDFGAQRTHSADYKGTNVRVTRIAMAEIDLLWRKLSGEKDLLWRNSISYGENYSAAKISTGVCL
jgi:hypothetical protein